MPSKGLMAFWALLDFLLLGAGGLSIAMSILFRQPNILLNIALSPEFLTAGMIVGIALCATFVVSLGAVVQRNHITMGFVILNWMLLVDSILIIVVGSMIWFFSLRQRSEFSLAWDKLSNTDKTTLQDTLHCCGYFNTTDRPVLGGTVCATQDLINALPTNDTASSCVGGITLATDYSLENTFTAIYGFMAVTISLLVCSLCVIKKRQESERFKKIDAKRGGRGFV